MGGSVFFEDWAYGGVGDHVGRHIKARGPWKLLRQTPGPKLRTGMLGCCNRKPPIYCEAPFIFNPLSMVFPVVMYGCESWTINKAEGQTIDAFELWGWRKLLRVPWTARRSKQSILKQISPGCSLEGLLLKTKLQSFGYLMRRVDSFEKTLMLGKIEGRRRGDDRE